MKNEIWAAVIGSVGAICAALIGKTWRTGSRSSVHFLKQGDNLKKELSQASCILMYAVNSFELCAVVNKMFEQDSSLVIKKLTILVRLKPDETAENLNSLRNVIGLWRKWHEKGNVSILKIVGYDHDPDHYYTIFGEKLVFVGQVLFDDNKVTQTNVTYTPLVFTDKAKLGKQTIENYRKHFENHLTKYEGRLMIFDSATKKMRDPAELIRNS